jgi:HlyD family secretion protein
MVSLADLSDLTLTVYVPEPDMGLVSLDQPVSVYVDTFPGERFEGNVSYISNEAEFTPKNVQTKEERVNTVFAVKIKLNDQNQLLKPGMPADAVLSDGGNLVTGADIQY